MLYLKGKTGTIDGFLKSRGEGFMKKKFVAAFIVVCLGISAPVYASEVFQQNMQNDFTRGFKNIVTGVFEIPYTIAQYHKGEGRPVIRHFAGLGDGIFRAIERTASGMWDCFAAFIPGQQDGIPVEPETFF